MDRLSWRWFSKGYSKGIAHHSLLSALLFLVTSSKGSSSIFGAR